MARFKSCGSTATPGRGDLIPKAVEDWYVWRCRVKPYPDIEGLIKRVQRRSPFSKLASSMGGWLCRISRQRRVGTTSLRGREGARAARARVDVPCAVSSCWDGLSMTAAPFSRLDENRMLATSVKPTACAGARVMELEKNSSGGIFRRPVTVSGRMQLTQEQERCRFLAHDGPLARAAAAGAQENLVVEEPFFDSKVVVGPEVVVTRQPTALDRAGSQGDKALLTPEERRQINDYKAKAEAARRLSRKARDQKTRLHCILRRCYPMGATGVDSPSNPSTEVYADARRKACKAEVGTSGPMPLNLPECCSPMHW